MNHQRAPGSCSLPITAVSGAFVTITPARSVMATVLRKDLLMEHHGVIAEPPRPRHTRATTPRTGGTVVSVHHPHPSFCDSAAIRRRRIDADGETIRVHRLPLLAATRGVAASPCPAVARDEAGAIFASSEPVIAASRTARASSKRGSDSATYTRAEIRAASSRTRFRDHLLDDGAVADCAPRR